MREISASGAFADGRVWGALELVYLLDVVVCVAKYTNGFSNKNKLSSYLL